MNCFSRQNATAPQHNLCRLLAVIIAQGKLSCKGKEDFVRDELVNKLAEAKQAISKLAVSEGDKDAMYRTLEICLVLRDNAIIEQQKPKLRLIVNVDKKTYR